MGIFHLSNGVANFTDEEKVFLAPLSKTPPLERSVQQHSLIWKACSVIFLLRLLITRHGYQTTIYKSKKLIIPLISCITCQRRSIFHSGENGMAAKIGLWIVLVGWSVILFLCVCRGRIAVFWTTSITPTPMHYWLNLLTSVSFLWKEKARAVILMGFLDWAWKQNCYHAGFCRSFISWSANRRKVKDLIRLLALEGVQMRS